MSTPMLFIVSAVVGASIFALMCWLGPKWRLALTPDQLDKAIPYHNARMFEAFKEFNRLMLGTVAGLGFLLVNAPALAALKAIPDLAEAAAWLVGTVGIVLAMAVWTHKLAKIRAREPKFLENLVSIELLMFTGMSAITILFTCRLVPAVLK